MITIEEAIQEIFARKLALPTERVALADAFGRYLANDIYADRDIPPFHRATVDGFALRSSDFTAMGQEGLPVAQKHFAGDPSIKAPPPGMALHIMTGAGVPEGLDLLFKIEDCKIVSGEIGEYITPPPSEKGYAPGLNIEAQGANKKKGETLVKAGTFIDAASVHALASSGASKVELYQKPTVAIVSTGTELVEIDQTPKPWQIRDTNRSGIAMALKAAPFAITPSYSAASSDDPESLKKTLAEGLKQDILIISGGVSMGDSDFVPAILKELGAEEIFHKVKIKPGKPLWFGVRPALHPDNTTGLDTIIFALPGNPQATMLSMKLFIEPFIMLSLGAKKIQGPIYLPLSHNRKLKGDRPHYFPARLINENNQTQIEALPNCGSGDIASTVSSDGMALHPLETRELGAGKLLAFFPWRSL